jgi:cyclophilin family peptidyl-prolyl cis-trans isomerase
VLAVMSAAYAHACEDSHSGCGSWADGGECQKNVAFMKDSCAASCGFCTPPPMLEADDDPLLGAERVVLQVQYGSPPSFGEIVLGFYPSVAPVTVAHILQLVRMGGYNTNEIFRVDKGFVAQVQGVDGGRRAPMSKALRAIAKKNVPDEFSSTLTHVRGMLSMGKFDEPDTGTSSFSMVLGNAKFLDGKYTIFGRVVAGDHVLSKLEALETTRDGIFVKPKERVEVVSAVLMYADGQGGLVLDEGERRKVEL